MLVTCPILDASANNFQQMKSHFVEMLLCMMMMMMLLLLLLLLNQENQNNKKINEAPTLTDESTLLVMIHTKMKHHSEGLQLLYTVLSTQGNNQWINPWL